jgi:hypothetical protein
VVVQATREIQVAEELLFETEGKDLFQLPPPLDPLLVRKRESSE